MKTRALGPPYTASMESTFARLVLTTAPNADEARRIAHVLVEERLAACVTLLPSVESIYRWEGKVDETTETLLLMKTGVEQLPTLEARLKDLHSYEVPEFLVLEVAAGSSAYLAWMLSNLSKSETGESTV